MAIEPADLPVAGTEVETLLGALDRSRSYIAWKCGGLTDEQMRQTLPPSTMTLGGLLKHLFVVEEVYFTYRLHGRRPASPVDSHDWDAEPDWDWTSARDDTAEELMGSWRASVDRSRECVAEALKHDGLDQLCEWTSDRGQRPSLRRVIVDIIEEYARHVGHADLIRESIDGLVGEDPE